MAGRRRAGRTSAVAAAFRRHRRLASAVAVIGALVLGVGIAAPAVLDSSGPLSNERAEASDAAATLVSLINGSRANAGLAPLASASDLTAVASERAQIMARSGALSHTPDLGSRVCCWTWLGENAAYAGSVSSLHNVMMGSAPHRANILEADADDVGVAVVSAGGNLWAAEVFRARSDSGSDRSSDATGTSRSGERTAPTTTSPTTGLPVPDTSYSGPSPAEIRRAALQQKLRNLREHMMKARHRNGPFDPVRAAVRFAGTLDRVSH